MTVIAVITPTHATLDWPTTTPMEEEGDSHRTDWAAARTEPLRMQRSRSKRHSLGSRPMNGNRIGSPTPKQHITAMAPGVAPMDLRIPTDPTMTTKRTSSVLRRPPRVHRTSAFPSTTSWCYRTWFSVCAVCALCVGVRLLPIW